MSLYVKITELQLKILSPTDYKCFNWNLVDKCFMKLRIIRDKQWKVFSSLYHHSQKKLWTIGQSGASDVLLADNNIVEPLIKVDSPKEPKDEDPDLIDKVNRP
ncbi:hypothetical protein YC2023_049710 [Brassica napus]